MTAHTYTPRPNKEQVTEAFKNVAIAQRSLVRRQKSREQLRKFMGNFAGNLLSNSDDELQTELKEIIDANLTIVRSYLDGASVYKIDMDRDDYQMVCEMVGA